MHRKLRFTFTVGMTLLSALSVSAATTQIRALLDLDDDVTSGCTVMTVDGPFEGVEVIHETTVESGAGLPTVTAISRRTCIDPASDSFGSPVAISSPFATPLAAGIGNGVDGSFAVESYLPLSGVATTATAHVGFETGSPGVGDQDALLSDGSSPMVFMVAPAGHVSDIPTASEWALIFMGLLLVITALVVMRRHPETRPLMMIVLLTGGATVAYAAGFVPDGSVGDWTGEPPLGQDGIGDAPSADLSVVFVGVEGNIVFFRYDMASFANADPVADAQVVGTMQDTPVAIVLTGSDADVDPLTFAIASGPARGVLTGTAPNVTYTPNSGFVGNDSFTFTVNDGTVDSAPATVSITVNAPGNTAPVADAQAVATTQDTPIVIALTGSDSDADPLTFAIASGPANGVLTGTSPNVTYTPSAGFVGNDSFTFTVNDGIVDSAPATVSITVNAPGNTTPVADAQAAATTQDTPIVIMLTGSDSDADPLTFAIVSGPASGVLTGTAPNVTYTPNAGFVGNDSFTFTVNDGIVDSAPATVAITVNAPGNTAPVADTQTVTTPEDTPVSITLTGSDAESDPLTFAMATGPANGVLTGTAPNVTYTPNANYNGGDSFTFTVNDGTVASSAATVTITVGAVNDPPSFTSTPILTATENVVYTYNATTADIDAGDTRTITAPTLPGWLGLTDNLDGTATLTGTSLNADVGANPVILEVTDLGGLSVQQSFTITVANVNDAPVIDLDADDSEGTGGNDFATTFTEDGGAIALADADASVTDIDDPTIDHITVTLTNLLDAGEELLDANVGGTLITKSYNGATGVLLLQGPDTLANFETVVRTVTYLNTSEDPDPASRLVTFVGKDGAADGPAANATVTVVPQNDAPVVGDQTFSIDENSANGTPVGTVVATDADAADTLSYAITAGNTGGAFAINTGTGEITVASSVALDFETTPSFALTVTVTEDGTGSLSDTATITIDLNDLNEAPIVGDQTFAVDENSANGTPVGTVVATEGDGGQTLTYAITAGNTGGAFAINAGTGEITVATSAALDFETTPAFSLTVEVTDDGGVPLSDTATITIDLNDLNEVPVLTSNATPSVVENTTAVVTVVAIDPEGVAVTYTITGGDDMALFSVDLNTGALSFKAAPDFEIPGDLNTDNDYLVQVTATDGTNPVVQNLTVTVTDVNEAPVFTSSATPTVPENTTAVVTVTTTDPEGDTVTYAITGGDDMALFSIDTNTGVLTFTAAPDFETPLDVNTDNDYLVEVTADDGNGNTPIQSLTVTVTDVNDPPTITSGATASFAENGTDTVVTVTATDPEGDTVTFAVTGGVDSGDLSIDTNTGDVTFNVTPDFEAPADDDGDNFYVIQVTATATGGTDVQTITIEVTNVNDPPTITSISSASFAENGVGTVHTVTATDPEGDTVTFAITGGLDSGDLGIDTDTGAITFNTPPDFEAPADADTNNTYVIEVTASSTGGTDVQTITITVTNVNEAPVITSGATANVSENTTSVMTVTATDPDGTSPTFQIVAGGDGASFLINPTTGALSFSAAPNFEAPTDGDANNVYTVTVRASDGTLSADETITVTVINVNEAPIAGTDTYTALGNTQLRVAGATGTGVAFTSNVTGLLANDSDPDTIPAFNTLTTAVATGPTNGTVTMGTDGSFTYISNAGFTGADNFTYTLSDGLNNVTGTISLTVSETVWYVHDTTDETNNPAAGDTGRSTNAYDSIAELNAANATTADDYIFTFNGNSGTTPYSGTITLKTGQKLYGEGYGLIVPTFGTVIAAGTAPRISTAADVVTVPATAGSLTNVEIRGLNLTSTAGNAIDVTTSGANSAGVTISNNTISGATAEGIDINHASSGAVTVDFQSNAVTSNGNGFDFARTSTGTGNAIVFSNNSVTSGTIGVNIAGGVTTATTITGFATNNITGNTGGTGVSVTNVTFDTVAGGAYTAVSAGNTAIGSSGNPVGGGGLILTNVAGDLSFAGLNIYAESGTGLFASSTGTFNAGTGTGFRLIASSGTDTIQTAGGPAVNISTATITLTPNVVTTTGSTTFGVSLNTVAGTFTAGSTSSISAIGSAAATAYRINNSSVNATWNGTIDTSQGTGVSLTSNSGTYAFTNTLTISTGTNPAFTATSSGTVSSTSTSSTLTTTTGTALNVANTNIAAANLVFRSISAGTVGSGPANGVILNNTGAAGGLKVNGTGSAGTGGTIQRTTGVGILLTSTQHVSLNWMNVQNSGDDGIRGSTVTDLTLANCVISANGNAVAEHGIEISQLLGSGSMSNCTVTGSGEHNVNIINTSGTLTAFNVTNSSFTNTNMTTGGDGFLLENNGTGVMTVSITGSTFTDNKGDHFQAATTAGASGTTNFTFSSNTLTTTTANDPNVVGGGITVSPSGSSDFVFTINANNIQQAFDEALNLNLGTASTAAASMIGTVSNNIIGTAGDVDSGSESGSGISAISNGAGYTRVAVTGNQVRQYANPYGILLMIKEGTSSMDATVTGNTVANPGSFAINGIRVDAGATAGDNGTLCAVITGNSVAGSGPGADTDIRLSQRFNTTIRLPGYGGANNDTTAVNSFVAGNNAGSDVSSAHNVGGGGGGYVGGAACPTP